MSKTEQQQSDSRVDWPVTFERTPPGHRERNNKFDVTLARSFSDLEDELERLGVDDYQYEFDARQRKRDKRPYANARPDDPSFVVRWSMDGEQYAVACDHYTRLRDNVRTVGHYLHEKRKMDSRPVETGESEFANARLPSGNEGADSRSESAVNESSSKIREEDEIMVAIPPVHRTLGVDPDATEEEIQDAYQRRVKEAHPDQGGTQEELERVREARRVMMEDL